MLRPLTESEQNLLMEQFLDYIQNTSEELYNKTNAWLEGWGESYEIQQAKGKEIKKPKITLNMQSNGDLFRDELKYAIVLSGALYGIVLYSLDKSKTPLINQLKEYMKNKMIKDIMVYYFSKVTIGYLNSLSTPPIKMEELVKESELDEIRKLLGLQPLCLHLTKDFF